MPTPITRRAFLKTSSLAGCGLVGSGCRGLFGTSEVRFAVVGLNGRGMALIEQYFAFREPEGPEVEMPSTRLVAICDVDTAILSRASKQIEERTGQTVEAYADYRKLLEQKHIDAVIIASPNHWHALQAIWALEAGKDVYVEKPVCHSVWEGRQLVAAAKYHKRIIQSGFQNRSDLGLIEAFPRIIAGELGPIQHIRGLCYKNRTSIGRSATPLIPPSTVDYDQWLGPADDIPLHRPKFHYDWHWFWNTGNGDIGNQGPHEMDLIRWILGNPDHPGEIFTFGERFAWDDAGETPNMQLASLVWNDIPVHFEVRDLSLEPGLNGAANFLGTRIGVVITCEGGQFRGGRGGGFFYDLQGKRMRGFTGDGGADHLPSFFRAVATRRRSELKSNIEEGFKSSCVSHLANISYQLGQPVSNAALRSTISGDQWLTEAHSRYVRHLEKWGLAGDQLEWTLGPRLSFDATTEQFTGAAEEQANPFLRRDGRSPYAIPIYHQQQAPA